MISRRGFFAGLVSALAAPAIVRAASLMPVKALVLPTEEEVRVFLDGRLIAQGGVWEPIVFRGMKLPITGGFPPIDRTPQDWWQS